jgi:PAS domain S-box-containing protein
VTALAAIDLVSALGFLGALALLWRVPSRVLPRECQVLLGVGLGIYAFVGVSNLAEVTGLTDRFDVYEDYAELLFIPFFVYFVYAYGTAREMDRRRATEAALRESEARYRALVNHIDLGILLLDRSRRVLMANEAAGRLLGFAAEKLVGELCYQVLAGRGTVCPDCPGTAVLATGLPQTGIVEHPRPGAPSMELRVQAFPLGGNGGRVSGFIEVLEDVTEQRRRAKLAEEADERLRQIVELGFEGICVTEEGRFVEVNEGFAATFGFRPGELLGTPVLDRVAPECREDVAEKMRQGYERPYESVCLRRDGRRFPVEVCAKGTTYRGRPARVTALRDLTGRKQIEDERRRVEQRLQQAQKLESLGVLAGGIAHDFNNLFMGILGNADLALMRLPAGSPERTQVARIVAAAERASELTRQMLTYAGQGPFHPRPLDLGGLIQDMAPLLQAAVGRKGTVAVATDPDLPPVVGDESRLRQVVLNLVTNAAEALGEQKGTVTVAAGTMEADDAYLASAYLDERLPPGRYAWFEVADTGCGMDPETRSRVFDPFFSTKFLGRGLGLPACLGIVRAHHGAIRLESEPGRGTSVRVLLPLAAPAPEPPAPETAAPGPDASP